MSEIKNLKPECIWRNFHALTQVPRPSGHLEKVQQFLLDFAKQAGVEAFKDEADNIVMRTPATPGMENRKTILLQAHMDMVPQKSPESTHDFENDPIEAYVDGEWVRAKGTTLGADDGIGVAAIMAVMEAKDLKHGPVEALITADEETGMFGANGLPENILNADILLNLDSETWGKFVIGSAGGIDVTAEMEYKDAETDPEDAALKITLKGLRGGHSGADGGICRPERRLDDRSPFQARSDEAVPLLDDRVSRPALLQRRVRETGRSLTRPTCPVARVTRRWRATTSASSAR